MHAITQQQCSRQLKCGSCRPHAVQPAVSRAPPAQSARRFVALGLSPEDAQTLVVRATAVAVTAAAIYSGSKACLEFPLRQKNHT
jgi:hypothetical protein